MFVPLTAIQECGFKQAKIRFPHMFILRSKASKNRKNILKPQSSAWIWGGQVAPPKSALQGALDLGFGGGAEGEIGRWIWKFALKTLCCPPKSALQGALDVGFGGGRLPPPNPSWRLGFKNIFSFSMRRGGWIVCPPTHICARGRPERWIWKREP